MADSIGYIGASQNPKMMNSGGGGGGGGDPVQGILKMLGLGKKDAGGAMPEMAFDTPQPVAAPADAESSKLAFLKAFGVQ